MKKQWIGIGAIGGVILILILWGIFFKSTNTSIANNNPLYWIDPMEPTVHYSHPGKSTMGMTLVPVYATGKTHDSENTLTISPTVIENLGIRIATVTKGLFTHQIETVGYVKVNENNIKHIHTFIDGWIRNLVVKFSGEYVKKGQLLFQLYSPPLINAQEEYLIALSSKSKDLIDASYKKLLSLGVSDVQIQHLNQSRKSAQLIDIYSPQNGIITNLDIREGMRVTPDTEIMTLADISSVWMFAEVFEEETSWIMLGQKADARLPAYPGQEWQGHVDYIYPQIDPTTHTLKIRLLFQNPNDILKPNMYANITLFGAARNNVVSIPKEALIRDDHNDHVIVYLGEGRFQVRNVVAGLESDDHIEIIAGLKEGEKIVVSGEFLIDSEANLHASLQRLNDSNGSSPP